MYELLPHHFGVVASEREGGDGLWVRLSCIPTCTPDRLDDTAEKEDGVVDVSSAVDLSTFSNECLCLAWTLSRRVIALHNRSAWTWK